MELKNLTFIKRAQRSLFSCLPSEEEHGRAGKKLEAECQSLISQIFLHGEEDGDEFKIHRG
jgi:hypothetical protein